MSSLNINDDDIVYRVQFNPPREISHYDIKSNTYVPGGIYKYWVSLWSSIGGETCTYKSLDTAKRSMMRNCVTGYTIHKMYLGLDPSKYFPPEKVFEK